MLLDQLGYPAEPEHVERRLERIASLPHARVLVAVSGGELVAVAAFQPIELLHRTQPQCRITGLVVRADRRREGIGRRLIEAIERMAHELGCFRLELTTRPERPDALPFYAALGFSERPHRLVKPILSRPPSRPSRPAQPRRRRG